MIRFWVIAALTVGTLAATAAALVVGGMEANERR
jgi:hypothetical protein